MDELDVLLSLYYMVGMADTNVELDLLNVEPQLKVDALVVAADVVVAAVVVAVVVLVIVVEGIAIDLLKFVVDVVIEYLNFSADVDLWITVTAVVPAAFVFVYGDVSLYLFDLRPVQFEIAIHYYFVYQITRCKYFIQKKNN